MKQLTIYVSGFKIIENSILIDDIRSKQTFNDTPYGVKVNHSLKTITILPYTINNEEELTIDFSELDQPLFINTSENKKNSLIIVSENDNLTLDDQRELVELMDPYVYVGTQINLNSDGYELSHEPIIIYKVTKNKDDLSLHFLADDDNVELLSIDGVNEQGDYIHKGEMNEDWVLTGTKLIKTDLKNIAIINLGEFSDLPQIIDSNTKKAEKLINEAQ